MTEILGEADPDLFAEILTFFVEAFGELSDRLNAAITTRDRAALRATAHAAKGAARNAASPKLAECLATLEATAEKEKWPTLAKKVKAVEAAFAEVRAFVAAGQFVADSTGDP
ncbi:Hpt domain-containing protein [Magnetospirillum fulvum]|uniref:Sensor protein n=1 Tax=Magnetospirillum fulvum MGU-K5 TaxID=1316936 RepID=S9SD13_MAGFU|nr:Hpt domain-containing protein [Magnetospirillum fulvum]EPY01968.1 Sensor protein [Magnetospirillum fulvum MGU-K5]